MLDPLAFKTTGSDNDINAAPVWNEGGSFTGAAELKLLGSNRTQGTSA